MKISSSEEMRRCNQLHSEIEAAYHDLSLKFKLSDSVAKILYTICSVGYSLPLNDIRRATGLSKQTVNSALRKLERDGIVYMAALDGKSKRVCLTEKGRRFADHTIFRMIEIENAIFASWPDSEVQKYLELTERFLVSLKEQLGQL